ncbi:MAG: translation elongation factor 4 [Chloroflexi bacterium]|nr:translation elongation factor 4 [Chloroflexota bacterium]
MTDPARIRNFCIIAHIDHGKSTLADRLLESTATIDQRTMVNQALDTMDIERERGVTIKASAVRMAYDAEDGERYELNLIDTPGHVDFTYEVSRALTACEGAVLIVDATQGVEAQTLANLYLAIDADLEIIPVINKIDLPAARPDEVAEEVVALLGGDPDAVIRISAKAGTNVPAVLEAVVRHVPPPRGNPDGPLRALVFDSHYDAFKGVVAYVRVFDGQVGTRRAGELRLMASRERFEPIEVGVFSPIMMPTQGLTAGEVGYIATGQKNVRDVQVGETITTVEQGASEPLAGYQPAKPMVFAGLYPTSGDAYEDLRDALDKLRLNDAALVIEPESSVALGLGFRCGFLGLFHMEIIQERLEREYDVDLLATAPSVIYQVQLKTGASLRIDNPAHMPDPSTIAEIREPWMDLTIWAPDTYIGPIMDLVTTRRGSFVKMEYASAGRVMLEYDIPLSELITEFYDQLKSRTRGYASMDYSFDDYRAGNLVKLDVLINEEPVDALSLIVHHDKAYHVGQALVRKLKEVIPRQMFKVPIQAAIGNKVISRSTVQALRKDVLSKCYGGDITRKRKLLEKQKEGKKRMKRIGSIEIPQEAFLAVLKLGED